MMTLREKIIANSGGSQSVIEKLLQEIEQLEAELRTRDNAEATHRITLREVQAETMRLQTKYDQLKADRDELLALVIRYRRETPLGHQPHMIAHLADAAIAKGEKNEPSN